MHFNRFLCFAFATLAVPLALSATTPAAKAQRADPSVSIADDGAHLAASPLNAIASPSFAGSGRELKLGDKEDALATPRTRLQEEDDERRVRRARPIRPATPQEGGAAETIIGVDQRRRVTPTTTFPARATVLILFSDAGGDFLCSGFLISRDTVATAGHCVAPGNASGFYDRTTYRIFPGRDGGTSPYGVCRASRLFSVVGWVNQGRDNFDYGAIKLNCNIGATTGWYGYTVSFPGVGTTTFVQGYPGDKPLTQWISRDQVRALDPRRVFYRNDTVDGMSGSPVWFNKNTTCSRCALAIHAYGTYGSGIFANNNHGTRINQEVFDKLTAWRNAPK